MMAKEKTGMNPVIPNTDIAFLKQNNATEKEGRLSEANVFTARNNKLNNSIDDSHNYSINTSNNLNSNSNINSKNGSKIGSDNNTQTHNSSKRNPAIDGLRALAIIGIVAFHLRPAMLQGGFLGVTLFLVLAGYFSTITLLHLYNKDLHIHYFKYLWNRIRRIWPSTLGIIALSAPFLWLFSPSLLPKLQSDALGGAGFFSNMMYVLRHVSYFDQAGLPSPIKHLWYLGLVMQAFVIWPVILLALIKFVRSAFIRINLTILLTLASTVTTAIISFIYGDGMTIARVYYSLDTRGSEFLIGALFAMYSTWFSKGSIRGFIADSFTFIFSNKERRKALIDAQESVYNEGQYSSKSENDLERESANESTEKFTNESIDDNSESSYKTYNYDLENNIPQDLRAGLQIDLCEQHEEQHEEQNSDIDIKELPKNVFSSKPRIHTYAPLASWIRSIIGICAVVILICAYVMEDGTTPWLPYGGYTLVALLCAIMLWACLQKDNLCYKILGFEPFEYLGKRSFALYLVHFPLFEILNPATRTSLASWWEQILQFLLAIAICEVFYRIFEMPLIKHKFSLKEANTLGSIDSTMSTNKVTFAIRDVFIVVCAAITVALIILPLNWKDIAKERSLQLRPELSANISNIQNNEKSNDSNKEKSNSQSKNLNNRHRNTIFKGKIENIKKISELPHPAKHKVLNPIAEKVPENLNTSNMEIDKKKGTCSAKLTMVGDSITEGAKPYLLKELPNAFIDGKVSRQIYHGADTYEKDASDGHKGDVVIYALGTNGLPRNDSVLQHMVDVAKGKPIYFVTTRVPQPWQDATNSRLRDFASRNPNVGIIDWHGLSNGHSEYLTDDGVHLTPVGDPHYARMIRLAICGG